MKFVALGRTRWLYDSIQAAVAAGHECVLIGTCPAAPEYDTGEEAFEVLAQELSCEFFCDVAINDTRYLQMVKESGAQIGMSVNWATLVKQPMLDLLAHGLINAHAGDLPRFRGNACPNWAILAGEERVVLTLHEMVPELDAGPVLSQSAFELESDTYIGDVYEFMGEQIPQMFAEVLDGIESGTVVPREQPKDPALSLRCLPRLPEDGLIRWDLPAEEICRLVRASAEPFAGAYTYIGEEKLIVWRARAEQPQYGVLGVPGHVAELRPDAGEVAVMTGDGFLVLEEVETDSGGRYRAAQEITSMRTRLGGTQ